MIAGLLRTKLDPRRLDTNLVLSFVLVASIVALAIGLPAVWLINRQFERQARAQVAQGLRASQALYSAVESEVRSFSNLTAQRPTIRTLLESGQSEDLPAYLSTLQRATNLDLIVICTDGREQSASTALMQVAEICSAQRGGGYLVSQSPDQTLVILYAQEPVPSDEGILGTVVAGIVVDDAYAEILKAETGLDQTILLGDRAVASTFQLELLGGSAMDAAGGDARLVEGLISGRQLRISGTPYYASRFALDGRGLEVEVALDVSDMMETRRALVWSSAAGILTAATIGSLIGVRHSRRINNALKGLTKAADGMRRGDLESPFEVDAHYRELSVVANALERARADLKHTLSQLRHEKAWSEDLVSAIVEGIVTLDKGRRITFFSPGAERITGWRQHEVLGSHCDQVFRLTDRDEPFSRAISAQPPAKRVSVQMRSGPPATLALTEAEMAPSQAGDAELVLVFRDVSEEEALHRLLGNFLANIAHEFRTPLSSLAASAELLMDQAEDLSSEELGELLRSLHLGTLSLQTLVDNLLESASIEAGHFRVHPRPADLAEIIGEATRWMGPLLAKREQRLVLDMPSELPVVRVDPRRTIQVMVNLLSNANKFSPDGSQIFVGVEHWDGWARVSVSDEGPGIPPENREDVFRRFSQLTRDEGGMQYGAGLGLSVVKAIVEALGGQVGVEGGKGPGATFWVTLPILSER